MNFLMLMSTSTFNMLVVRWWGTEIVLTGIVYAMQSGTNWVIYIKFKLARAIIRLLSHDIMSYREYCFRVPASIALTDALVFSPCRSAVFLVLWINVRLKKNMGLWLGSCFYFIYFFCGSSLLQHTVSECLIKTVHLHTIQCL